ncbi:MAG: glycosyl transferase [Candidatus Woesearchaeota archaeon]|nr:MAG: glycosyl transferase [Candidatus Woesearchaeota archaeon]
MLDYECFNYQNNFVDWLWKRVVMENGSKKERYAECLFEVSWEVCNKVGGINTVISTKSSYMIELYDNYFLIGPYFERNARTDFIVLEPPVDFKEVFDDLKEKGIVCYYGKYLSLRGKPSTILIDFGGLYNIKNEIKKKFWDDYHIDSIRAGWDFEEPMLWAYSVGVLIESLYKKSFYSKKVVAHFHEWLSGFALLYLRKTCKDIATVFTTHATILGRTLSSKGISIYENISSINVTYEVYLNNIEAKHQTEVASARNAHVFTTVSEITALESEFFLGRKPDFLLMNGLDLEKFPNYEELSINHLSYRSKIEEFLMYYFFPYYSFDLSRTLIIFTSGRFEFKNKGYDLIIKTLGVLNKKLKELKINKQLLMIFWVPMQNYGIRKDVLENKNYYMNIKGQIMSYNSELIKRIIYNVLSGNNYELLSDSLLDALKKEAISFSRKGNPPLSTHYVDDDNILIKSLIDNALLNNKDDPVKVIVEPVYLEGNDGLIDLSYHDAMSGCNLGLFPSYYEPWGYTPLESAVLGVPSVTTDMAGFGRYIQKNIKDNEGIFVLKRFGRNDVDVINDFCNFLISFINKSSSEMVDCRLKAKFLSAYAGWSILVDNYIDAHNYALELLHK